MKTQLKLPKIILGTSSLGNLYQALPFDQKLAIVKEVIDNSTAIPFFDTAGKYGAGLSLESLGKALKALNVSPESVMISNKLGWLRKPLITSEPTFEPGVWKDLSYDAYQDISYNGILKCFEQGNELLNGYQSQYVSVHDPDEYLNAAIDEKDREIRFNNILEAYQALAHLKANGKVTAIGVGSKDWRIIQKISEHVDFDWVMFANSLTVYSHPQALLDFITTLKSKDVTVINSAVFNGGFLIGSDYFNYKLMDRVADKKLYEWREQFYSICEKFNIEPAAACIYFALNVPRVDSIALNSTSPQRTAKNINMAEVKVPKEFWSMMKNNGLMVQEYPYL